MADVRPDSALAFRPLAPKLESGLCIAWKKHQAFSRAGELFLAELRRRFAVDGDDGESAGPAQP